MVVEYRQPPAGEDLVKISAAQHIDPVEETTVAYGDYYFGENNVECLCGTCKKTSSRQD